MRKKIVGGASAGPLVGREDALAFLRAAAADRTGLPRAVLVEGPAGAGKTTLMRHFVERLPDVRVVEVRGSEDEQLLAFGLAEVLFRRLSAGGAAGRGARFRPAEFSEAGGRVLAALTAAERNNAALVLVIDDAQWADRPSLQAMAFALRRLEADPVLTLLAARSPLVPGSGLDHLVNATGAERLTLRALQARDIQELGTRLGRPLTLAAASRLARHTAGLPLHVATLFEELDDASLGRPTGPLPAPRSFATVVLQRLAASPAGTEALVTAAAVLGEVCELAVVGAVAELGDPLPPLDAAVRAGLLEHRQDRRSRDEIHFSHALVRAAVLDALAPARHAKLHARAAAHLDGLAALEHRAAASLLPDAGLAIELGRQGHDEVAAGAVDLGVHHLLEAARLMPEADARRALRLAALEALVHDGALAAANELAADVGLNEDGGAGDAQVAYLRGHLALVNGRRADAEKWLKRAWEFTDPSGDPARASLTAVRLAQLTGVFGSHGRQEEAAIWAERALALAGEHPVFGAPISGILAVALVLTGRAEEASMRALPDAVTAEALAAGYSDEVLARGIVRLWTDELAAARADLAVVAYPGGWAEPLQTRLFGLALLADAEYRAGRWDDALAAAELGVSLAEDADYIWLMGLLHGMAALPRAARGEWESAAKHAEAARMAAELVGDLADVALAAARGDSEGVIAATDAVAALDPARGTMEPGVLAWPAMRAEALAATGRTCEAAELLDAACELARARDRRSALLTLIRARGFLEFSGGNPEAATGILERATDLAATSGMPFEAGLTHLAYGTHLRRRGARRKAADQLQAAQGVFKALGARPMRNGPRRSWRPAGCRPAGAGHPVPPSPRGSRPWPNLWQRASATRRSPSGYSSA